MNEVDIIGGFPEQSLNCKGCGKSLLIENAWMTDGCPCNSRLGINSMNETRWRLLMQLQQQQSREIERLREIETAARALIYEMKSTCGCGYNINDCHCGNTPRSQNEVLADLYTMIGRLSDSIGAIDREEQQPADTAGEKSEPLPPHTFLKGSQ